MKPSHLGDGGAPHMVDVGSKAVTARRAVAAATVRMRPDVLATLLDAGGPKGDAFVVARLAGIGGAKRTSDLIPLCHPLPLDSVEVSIESDRAAGVVRLTAEARTTARTGVEMEAMTAASVAALALYDMAKALQRDIVIERVELLRKEGGRSGVYERGAEAPVAEHEAAVVTISNRSAAGTREDTSGPPLVAALRAAGWDVEPEVTIVPDDEERIAALLARLADAGHRLILTTGGTGLTPTDRTPA
ncbi:MAG TPA: cyclic pyranopterin monophosphate synthase MoaC, partial [Candidatus Limnocylindria bacterium]|nr:cyclic pyranopterin monophosphate synthase MoaC [Candidatus Limnocylindria bacterium]